MLAACGGKAAPSPAPAVPVHEFAIGSLRAYALLDGTITVPNDGKILGIGHPPADVSPAKTIDFSIQPLLVKDGAHVLLFDTGAADASFAKAGMLPRALATIGVAPAQITDIFISHRHPDHIGGLVDHGRLAFPNATIHITKPEWDKLQSDDEVKAIGAIIAPNVDAFEPGAQLLPEVTAVATPGHTPGHSSYDIHSGDDHLFYLGDVAHHSIVSVQHPDWRIEFDSDDHVAAEAMRTQTLAKLAADHTHVFAVHFPFPGLGHVVDGKWVAD